MRMHTVGSHMGVRVPTKGAVFFAFIYSLVFTWGVWKVFLGVFKEKLGFWIIENSQNPVFQWETGLLDVDWDAQKRSS